MKFFLDENFPKSATGMLEHLGHVVFDLRVPRERDQGMQTFSTRPRNAGRSF